MKTIYLATILIITLSFIGCSEKSSNLPIGQHVVDKEPVAKKKEVFPNIIAVSTQTESSFVKPEDYIDWLFQRKPSGWAYGQINAIRVGDNYYVTTASHVLRDLNKVKKFPESPFLEHWIECIAGTEISIAELKSWHSFGFESQPFEITEAKTGAAATMKTTAFVSATEGVRHLELSGVLEEITSLEKLHEVGSVMSQDSSFGDRLRRRAPQARILFMLVDIAFDSLLQGSSGAIIWQNEKPIGVFVAKITLDQNNSSILLIEPLSDILPSIK